MTTASFDGKAVPKPLSNLQALRVMRSKRSRQLTTS